MNTKQMKEWLEPRMWLFRHGGETEDFFNSVMRLIDAVENAKPWPQWPQQPRDAGKGE